MNPPASKWLVAPVPFLLNNQSNPIFGAHTFDATVNDLYNSTGPVYLPDHEATAMACMDQFQLCFGPESTPWCSNWNNGSEVISELIAMWKQKPTRDLSDRLKRSFMDVFTFIPSMIDTSRVHQSLAVRNNMQPQQVLVRDGFQTFRQRYGGDQWTLEVETFLHAVRSIGRLNYQGQVPDSAAHPGT